MSKNYILEPVEVEFSAIGTDALGTLSPSVLTLEDILGIPSNAVLQIGDYIFKYAEPLDDNAGIYFDEDGDPDTFDIGASVYIQNGNVLTFAEGSEEGEGFNGTYTVSIYTETEDSDSKPYIDEKLSKNVTYTDHPHNNWEAFLEKMTGDKTGYNTIEKIANASGNNSEGE